MSTIAEQHAESPLSEAERRELAAYNAAFAELGFAWRWSPAEFRELDAIAGPLQRVRHYVETRQPHLLKAYDAHALAKLIVELKADCQNKPRSARSPRRIDLEFA